MTVVFADVDGKEATLKALAHAMESRVAVWVGSVDDPELEEMRAELGLRHDT